MNRFFKHYVRLERFVQALFALVCPSLYYDLCKSFYIKHKHTSDSQKLPAS